MSRKDHKAVAVAGGWRSLFSRGRTHSMKGAGYKPPPGTFQQYHAAQGEYMYSIKFNFIHVKFHVMVMNEKNI